MAHDIAFYDNDAAIAYAGEVPWHGLGRTIEEHETRDLTVVAAKAQLNWRAELQPVFIRRHGEHEPIPHRRAIVHSLTGDVLGVVSDRYKVVQPMDVLEFYRDLIDELGYKMEVAGNLRGGRRVWALARAEQSFRLRGDDQVDRFLLLATAYDGSMATICEPTSVRVVCQNTLSMAVGADGKLARVQIPHLATFNPDAIKDRLGLVTDAVAWRRFQQQAMAMAERRVSREEAIRFFAEVFWPEAESVNLEHRGVKARLTQLIDLYEHGPGARLPAADHTAWGLLNAVTRWADHERGTRSADARLERAWFGDSAMLKERARSKAAALAEVA